MPKRTDQRELDKFALLLILDPKEATETPVGQVGEIGFDAFTFFKSARLAVGKLLTDALRRLRTTVVEIGSVEIKDSPIPCA